MRFLVKATMPVEAGNAFVRDPNFEKLTEEILAEVKPEAVYFALEGGQRTLYFVVNVGETHQIPGIAEPLWLSLKASVEFIPALDQAEFARAVPAIQRAASKF